MLYLSTRKCYEDRHGDGHVLLKKLYRDLLLRTAICPHGSFATACTLNFPMRQASFYSTRPNLTAGQTLDVPTLRHPRLGKGKWRTRRPDGE